MLRWVHGQSTDPFAVLMFVRLLDPAFAANNYVGATPDDLDEQAEERAREEREAANIEESYRASLERRGKHTQGTGRTGGHTSAHTGTQAWPGQLAGPAAAAAASARPAYKQTYRQREPD
eukprot:scaffold10225_cov146-Isochrysis_galbana.AAC.3